MWALIVKIVIAIILIKVIAVTYMYFSGSCKINKSFPRSSKFTLLKRFNFSLGADLQKCVHKMVANKSIQKRLSIKTFPETFFNCAMPNKKGITISTANILKHCPQLVKYYQTCLRDTISNLVGLEVFPTSLKYPTSCALLIYNEMGDWINWHYDYNYYNGRFFTVLIPITKGVTCTKYEYYDENGIIQSIDLTNFGICFEGNYVYHRASKLCAGEHRVILSCQFVTDNTINWVNRLRIKIKDFAYTGKL